MTSKLKPELKKLWEKVKKIFSGDEELCASEKDEETFVFEIVFELK